MISQAHGENFAQEFKNKLPQVLTNRIVGVELSHQKAPLAVREHVSLSKEEVRTALNELKLQVPEIFIIATCNRLSVYAVSDDVSPILNFFRRFGPVEPYLSVFEGDVAAIRHLFATASGLESQALGEHEILGQIKHAFALAQECESVGPIMDELVRRAISVGKKVRKETAIGQYPVSLASVAFDLIREKHRDFSKLNMLVLGTGEMSSLVLKIFSKKNLPNLFIASRTPARAESLAAMHGGKAVSLDSIAEVLPQVDVVVGATHTETYVLRKNQVEELTGNKMLIDLGLPRNFDPDAKKVDNVKLYDLDDLKSITYQGLQKRQEEIPKALEMVDKEVIEFGFWLNTRKISPVITSYYQRLEQIRDEELKWALPKLGQLDENQQKLVAELISRVTRRMSGKPIEKLRNFSQDPQLEQNPIDTFKELFDL